MPPVSGTLIGRNHVPAAVILLVKAVSAFVTRLVSALKFAVSVPSAEVARLVSEVTAPARAPSAEAARLVSAVSANSARVVSVVKFAAVLLKDVQSRLLSQPLVKDVACGPTAPYVTGKLADVPYPFTTLTSYVPGTAEVPNCAVIEVFAGVPIFAG